MASYTTKAEITVLKNGSVEVLYEVEPGFSVELDDFVTYKKEEAEGKKARLAGEVAAAGKLSKKARVRAFLKKVIEKAKAKKAMKGGDMKKENIQKAKEKGLSLLKFKDEGYYVNLTTMDLYKRSPSYEVGELVGKFVPPVRDVSFARIIPLSEIEEEKPKAKAGAAVGAGAGEAARPTSAASKAYEKSVAVFKEEYDKKRATLMKAGRFHYDELRKLREIADKAPLPEITKDNAIDPYFKELKVGDVVHSTYAGESQESASVTGYIGYKITGISKSGLRFELESTSNFPRKHTGSIQVNIESSYMSISPGTEKAYPEAFVPTFESAIAKRVAEAFYQREIGEKRAKLSTKKQEDWTKKSKYELVSLIDDYFQKKGKTLRGHKTASKPELIEIIKKYKIMGDSSMVGAGAGE